MNLTLCGLVMPYGITELSHQLACWLFGIKPLANADLLSFGPLGTNCSDIWIKIQDFSLYIWHIEAKKGCRNCTDNIFRLSCRMSFMIIPEDNNDIITRGVVQYKDAILPV